MAEADGRNADQIEAWNGASGQQWIAQQEHQDRVLRPVSDVLLPAADARPGMRVLDVGCGCGDTTLEVTRRIAPGGHAIGLDISVPMLARARERAPAGAPVDFIAADATTYDFPAADADLLMSRFGVMFFADPVRAFANMRKGMKSGGRVAFACWRPIETCPWMTVPGRAASSVVPADPDAPAVDFDAPGPFAFARPERVTDILTAAGFTDVALASHDLTFDVAAGQGLDAAVDGLFKIGPARRAVANQPPDVHAAARQAVRAELLPYAKGQSVPLGGGIWIVTARNP